MKREDILEYCGFGFLVLMLIGMIWFTLSIATAEHSQSYQWVVEREKRSGEQVQADFDTLAAHGFRPTYDDDLEKSGHFVYFERYMKPSEALPMLPVLEEKLKVSRRVK